MVTHNNLLFTTMCLASLAAHTQESDYELIVVDNGSSDGTPEFLALTAQVNPRVRLVLNKHNLGFAPACNQGLAVAVGTTLVLLNNDTIVPAGWLVRLIRHLDDPSVALVGPITNRTGNEAQVGASYHTFGEFSQRAADYASVHAGRTFEIPMLTMFCLAMSRTTYQQLGPLDERYEVGMFEDDDYAMRARAAGYRIMCAEDVFVHHFGGASFGELAPTGKAGALFQANRRRFEAKWGVSWRPHLRRPEREYRQLIESVREIVRARIPAQATVMVINKGDDEFLKLGEYRAWHFPRGDDGAYAGHYPADSLDAIAQLERLRAQGGEYLVIPRPALWWLDHYRELRRYLDSRCRRIVEQNDLCFIYQLTLASARPESGELMP
jgi:GT2 family glycosyltransferase